ncbi:MAG: type II secretion system F family protein [Pirellulales bacterium]
MLRALTVLSQQSNNKNLNAVLSEVKSRVEEGIIGRAMARFPRVFNDMAVNMVRAQGDGR